MGVVVTVRVEGRLPNVQGRCPACKNTTLFLGEGGYVTCGWDACPNRVLADELLHFTEWPPEAIEAAVTALTDYCDTHDVWNDADMAGVMLAAAWETLTGDNK